MEPTTTQMPHLGYCPDCEYLGDQPDPHRDDQNQVRLTTALVATVVFLTAIAPLATDMYVPAFPHVARDRMEPQIGGRDRGPERLVGGHGDLVTGVTQATAEARVGGHVAHRARGHDEHSHAVIVALCLPGYIT